MAYNNRCAMRLAVINHGLLWLYLAQSRADPADRKSDFGAAVEGANLDKGLWPYPVIELFNGGQPTPEATLVAAKSLEERCEVLFYIGEWHLIRGERAAAIDSLQAAMKDACPKNTMEFLGAELELQRLLNVSASTASAAPASQ